MSKKLIKKVLVKKKIEKTQNQDEQSEQNQSLINENKTVESIQYSWFDRIEEFQQMSDEDVSIKLTNILILIKEESNQITKHLNDISKKHEETGLFSINIWKKIIPLLIDLSFIQSFYSFYKQAKELMKQFNQNEDNEIDFSSVKQLFESLKSHCYAIEQSNQLSLTMVGKVHIVERTAYLINKNGIISFRNGSIFINRQEYIPNVLEDMKNDMEYLGEQLVVYDEMIREKNRSIQQMKNEYEKQIEDIKENYEKKEIKDAKEIAKLRDINQQLKETIQHHEVLVIRKNQIEYEELLEKEKEKYPWIISYQSKKIKGKRTDHFLIDLNQYTQSHDISKEENHENNNNLNNNDEMKDSKNYPMTISLPICKMKESIETIEIQSKDFTLKEMNKRTGSYGTFENEGCELFQKNFNDVLISYAFFDDENEEIDEDEKVYEQMQAARHFSSRFWN